MFHVKHSSSHHFNIYQKLIHGYFKKVKGRKPFFIVLTFKNTKLFHVEQP